MKSKKTNSSHLYRDDFFRTSLATGELLSDDRVQIHCLRVNWHETVGARLPATYTEMPVATRIYGLLHPTPYCFSLDEPGVHKKTCRCSPPSRRRSIPEVRDATIIRHDLLTCFGLHITTFKIGTSAGTAPKGVAALVPNFKKGLLHCFITKGCPAVTIATRQSRDNPSALKGDLVFLLLSRASDS